MLLKSISGACNGCMFGIGTEGADVLTMQGVALVIAGTMDIVCDTDLLTSLDQDKLIVLPICNKGA